MPRSVKKFLENRYNVDETDKTPADIEISIFDILLYVIAIVSHIIDLFIDLNVCVRYFFADEWMEFGWTLAFILLPAFVNTAVSIRMYTLDKDPLSDSINRKLTKMRTFRLLILIFQMSPILHFIDGLIYAVKSREAGRREDRTSQRRYYRLMLKSDSDGALIRIFECFLEAAPQQVLQMTFLYRGVERFKVHQVLSICSSVVSMGYCLASYQRAIRFAQEDKANMNWIGSLLQTLWHFNVTLSRVTSISIIAYIYPELAIAICLAHALVMSTWIQFFDRSNFCSHNRPLEVGFSLIMGLVYIFTYILTIEGRTRYRYLFYYTFCFMENVACCAVWMIFTDRRLFDKSMYLIVAILSLVPFVIGICFMVIYYRFFHPKYRLSTDGFNEINIIAKRVENDTEL